MWRLCPSGSPIPSRGPINTIIPSLPWRRVSGGMRHDRLIPTSRSVGPQRLLAPCSLCLPGNRRRRGSATASGLRSLHPPPPPSTCEGPGVSSGHFDAFLTPMGPLGFSLGNEEHAEFTAADTDRPLRCPCRLRAVTSLSQQIPADIGLLSAIVSSATWERVRSNEPNPIFKKVLFKLLRFQYLQGRHRTPLSVR